jgi:hypothetical protein
MSTSILYAFRHYTDLFLSRENTHFQMDSSLPRRIGNTAMATIAASTQRSVRAWGQQVALSSLTKSRHEKSHQTATIAVTASTIQKHGLLTITMESSCAMPVNYWNWIRIFLLKVYWLIYFFKDDDEHEWITITCRKGWDENVAYKDNYKVFSRCYPIQGMDNNNANN